ncbi:hypothetical protein [Hymenobacter tenuis]
MRKLLRFLTFICFAPVRYPYAGLYHFVVGAVSQSRLCSAHHVSFSWCLLVGGLVGGLVGLVGYVLCGYALVKLEREAK